MLYKENWDKAKERLTALWENEIIDRCCISITVPKDGSVYEAIDHAGPGTEESLSQYYTDPETVLERNLQKFENTAYLGEALPCVFPDFGTGGHAMYFDCKYEFAQDTIWMFPIIHDWEKDTLAFNSRNEMLLAEKALIKQMAALGKNKFFVSMPDNCGSMDALAHLRGSDKLLLDMLEEPDQVKASVKKLITVLKSTGNEFYDFIRENNGGGSTHAEL